MKREAAGHLENGMALVVIDPERKEITVIALPDWDVQVLASNSGARLVIGRYDDPANGRWSTQSEHENGSAEAKAFARARGAVVAHIHCEQVDAPPTIEMGGLKYPPGSS